MKDKFILKTLIQQGIDIVGLKDDIEYVRNQRAVTNSELIMANDEIDRLNHRIRTWADEEREGESERVKRLLDTIEALNKEKEAIQKDLKQARNATRKMTNSRNYYKKNYELALEGKIEPKTKVYKTANGAADAHTS